MTASCPRAFDETLVSGHLDGELTQAAAQKVRLHLEDCAHCRALLDDLRAMREATMSTEFVRPDDDQWDERPRGTGSLLARGAGWVLAVVWLVAVAGYGLWQFWQSAANPVERLLVFGGLAAAVLLFVSVVLDRISSARTDPYREVQK
jgi:predicted anti-sigma-YlaC factor YlaD